jgi:hypothetical protein
MNNVICCIPADNVGNKLWIKDARADKERLFLKYKSTYNQMPFMEVEVFAVDGGENLAITGDDGTILYRFSSAWINKLLDD